MTSASLQRVVIFIQNHSHDSSGELYVGPNLCGPVSYVRLRFIAYAGLINSLSVVYGMSFPQ
jgi:hypothetical protein